MNLKFKILYLSIYYSKKQINELKIKKGDFKCL